MSHGYYGIAVHEMKTEANFGGVLRSAHAFDAAFVCLIGARYKKWPTDTSKASRHIPVYTYDDMDSFLSNRPHDCEIVRVEVNGTTDLPQFTHKPRAIYLLGGEDMTLSESIGDRSVRIDTTYCLNLASTASIVMYDRHAKGKS